LLAPQRPDVVRHLLALSAEDRRRRFMISASDAYIERYVATIDFDAGFVFGAFQDGRVCGVAHAASGSVAGKPALEVGLSVDQDQRRRGLGRALLRECLNRAAQGNAVPVVVHFQPGNRAMAATAHSLGAVASRNGGETRAEFPHPGASPHDGIRAASPTGAAHPVQDQPLARRGG
jgi:GNAT superfamily N-acetyltransferase